MACGAAWERREVDVHPAGCGDGGGGAVGHVCERGVVVCGPVVEDQIRGGLGGGPAGPGGDGVEGGGLVLAEGEGGAGGEGGAAVEVDGGGELAVYAGLGEDLLEGLGWGVGG